MPTPERLPMPPATRSALAHHIGELEVEVFNTERVHGALRAVSCLVQPWRHSEEHLVVENLKRNDLAQLLSLLSDELGDQLGALEGKVSAVQVLLPLPER